MYFADESAANAEDPVLRSIEQVGCRATLVANAPARTAFRPTASDIRLQGDAETVFFDM